MLKTMPEFEFEACMSRLLEVENDAVQTYRLICLIRALVSQTGLKGAAVLRAYVEEVEAIRHEIRRKQATTRKD